MRRCFFVAVCTIILSQAFAEDLRAKVAADLSLSAAASEGQKASLGYSDGVGILLPEDLSFIEGVEIELRVPPAAQAVKGSFIFFIFKKLSPAPDPKSMSYSGERAVMSVVPARLIQVYQIPIRKNSSLKNSPYATILPTVAPEDFPIMFRLMPAMKGLPDEMENSVFQVRAKPIFVDEGRVKVSFKWAEGLDQASPLTVTVDDAELANPREALLLKPGTHSLRVSGQAVRDVFQTFTVAQARTLELAVELQDVTPRLLLEFPEKTRIGIELDGKPLAVKDAREAIALSPGEHSVGFFVGDYSIQRRIQVQRGKTYRVSLLVDVKVEEEN
jgi:hypothetical protein